MNLFEARYHTLINTPSDINYHLPTLYEYAKRCDHITEFGAYNGISTTAFFFACPKRLISYDLYQSSVLFDAFEESKGMGLDYSYIIANDLDVEIEPTDLLFIDTYHSENQLDQELNLHSHKVRRYIIFHDVDTYGWTGEGGGIGIFRRIMEFLTDHKEWRPVYYTRINHGLLVIEKCNAR